MNADFKFPVWFRGIPVWYWWWSFGTVCIGLALMLDHTYSKYLIMASVMSNLILITNHVIFTIISYAKNPKLFQNK